MGKLAKTDETLMFRIQHFYITARQPCWDVSHANSVISLVSIIDYLYKEKIISYKEMENLLTNYDYFNKEHWIYKYILTNFEKKIKEYLEYKNLPVSPYIDIRMFGYKYSIGIIIAYPVRYNTKAIIWDTLWDMFDLNQNMKEV